MTLATRAVLAVLLFAGSASAQTSGGGVRVGDVVPGELTATSDRLSDGRYFRSYDFQSARPQRLRISVTSGAFDPVVVVYRCDGGCREIARDDDGGDGLNALLTTNIPGAGDYTIVVVSHTPNAVGAYRLFVEDGSAGDAPRYPATPSEIEKRRPTRAVVGEAMAGILGDGDSVAIDGAFYDFWSFDGAAGAKYVVILRSRDFMGSVIGGVFADTGFTPFPGEPALSQGALYFINVGQPGWYTLKVKGSQSGQRGAYTLRVVTQGTVISIGESANGALEPSDRTLTDDSYFDEWMFLGGAGDHLRVHVSSRGFAPFLFLGRYEEEQNDGVTTDLTSSTGRIDADLSAPGWYVIRISSQGAGAKPGSYTLRVERR